MRQYVVMLLIVVAGWGGAIAWYAATIPPYSGDLTRMGGYSESDFGWRDAMSSFDPPLHRADHFGAGVDLLVVGDSITVHRPGEQTDPGAYWPGLVAQATGWTVATLHRRSVFIDELVDSEAFREHPPRALIFEFAERAILGAERVVLRTGGTEQQCVEQGQRPPLLGSRAPLRRAPIPVEMALDAGGFHPTVGAHHLKRILLRTLRPSHREVHEFTLSRADLFSSDMPERLLVYYGDLLKLEFDTAKLEAFWCSLSWLQHKVEAGGTTRFAVMIVPDKLSAYARHVRELPDAYPELADSLPPPAVLDRIDVATPLREAIGAGVRDVYLPNDTHLGTPGHRIVAEATVRALTSIPAAEHAQ